MTTTRSNPSLPCKYRVPDAADFRLFCERNPKPCPLLAQSAPGDPRLAGLGEDLDIRTDVSRYRVFRDGVLEDEVTTLENLWRDAPIVHWEEATEAAGNIAEQSPPGP